MNLHRVSLILDHVGQPGRRLGTDLGINTLALVLIDPAVVRNTRMNVLFRDADSADRIRIAVARLQANIHFYFLDWPWNVHVSVVSDHVLLQAGWMSKRNVWWSRQPDGRSRHWHSVLRCRYTGDDAWQRRWQCGTGRNRYATTAAEQAVT